jgi:ATP phosphoribosyltransferase
MLEMNVAEDKLAEVVKALPCMRAPTVSPLFGGKGYSVKTAIKKHEAAGLITLLKKMGANDILETEFRKVVL